MLLWSTDDGENSTLTFSFAMWNMVMCELCVSYSQSNSMESHWSTFSSCFTYHCEHYGPGMGSLYFFIKNAYFRWPRWPAGCYCTSLWACCCERVLIVRLVPA